MLLFSTYLMTPSKEKHSNLEIKKCGQFVHYVVFRVYYERIPNRVATPLGVKSAVSSQTHIC